jgi:hypothetical protein
LRPDFKNPPNPSKEVFMKALSAPTALLLIIWIALVAPSFGGPLPPSGEETCYDTQSEVPHPQPGRIIFGSPRPANVPEPKFIKLDETGIEMPEESGAWAMVQDQTTGLVWEIKHNKDGNMDTANPHDADNLFRWYNPDPATNAGTSGMSGTDTYTWLLKLNEKQFGGFSDWRLPTIYELARLADYHRFYPSISIRYFPETMASFYWSSSSVAGFSRYAWGIYMSDGCDYFLDKMQYAGYVMAVRGKPVTDNLAHW